MKKASCACTITIKNPCSFWFGEKTLLDETQEYDRENTKATCIAISKKMQEWSNPYSEIREKHNHISLTLQVCIDGESRVFQTFTACRLFLSEYAACDLEDSGYTSFPRTRRRSVSF